MQINIEYDKEINQIFLKNGNRTLNIDRTEIATVENMATDRQTPCLYYVCAGLCTKGRKADHAHYCQHCNKYRPRAKVRYKNQKKEKLEKIRKNERY